jgi:hypothetical protein
LRICGFTELCTVNIWGVVGHVQIIEHQKLSACVIAQKSFNIGNGLWVAVALIKCGNEMVYFFITQWPGKIGVPK